MPYDNSYTTIMVSKTLSDELNKLCELTAKKEGVSKINRPTMIEKMIKIYKEKHLA